MDKEYKTLKFIESIYNNRKRELYAGNSGGKDSAVLDFLLQKSGIKYTSLYANTTIDPPKTISYIRHNYPHTIIIQPKLSFYKLVQKRGLPTRLSRYCCSELKEYLSVGRTMFEGVRKSESIKRAKREMIQCDNRKWQKKSEHIYPLFYWTDNDIKLYIKNNGIILNENYKYMNRIGCVGCPLATRKNRKKEFEIFPKIYNMIKNSIKIGMLNNPQWKLSKICSFNETTAMNWWLSGCTMDEYFKNDGLFAGY